MGKDLMIILVSLQFFTVIACQKSKTIASSAEAEVLESATEGEIAGAEQKTETSVPATCRSLNIPTYDLLIKDLSALRCDNCHNETFAWRGIVLTQYDSWKTYVKPIRNRIFYNFLTQPLEPGEQDLFLAWIDNGLPRTDTDCANLK